MESDERANWRLNIEDAAVRIITVAGYTAASGAFAIFGAKDVDDLPEKYFRQVFSEPIRLAAD